MYNVAMEMLILINTYIKYAYYLLGIIIFICLIALIKAIKPLIKTIGEISDVLNNIKAETEEIKVKIEKIKYTIENSVPLFAFLFFMLIVLVSAIKDFRDTRLTKRSIVKSTVKQYNVMNKKFNPKRTKKYRKAFINELKRLA